MLFQSAQLIIHIASGVVRLGMPSAAMPRSLSPRRVLENGGPSDHQRQAGIATPKTTNDRELTASLGGSSPES